MAINKDNWLLFAIPEKIKDKNNFAEVLSKIIKESEKSIISKLEKSNSYTVIKKDLSVDDVDKIKKLKLDGLYWENSQNRYYPQEKLASQVVGFLGGDGSGQYGIEGYYEDVLKGKEGIQEKKGGLSIINSEDSLYLNGSDLFLTIDYNR